MSERVIWERDIDHERIRARTAQFQRRFGIPAAILLVVVLLFGGARNAIGVLLLVALIGLAWGMTVRFQNLSDAANPRLVVKGGRLVLGDRSVIIEDVKRYTTIATSIRTNLVSKLGAIDLGKIVFRMDVPRPNREADLVEFGWPNMAADELATLAEAVEPVLAGKWVEPEDLLDPEERSQHGKRRSSRRSRGRGLGDD